MPEAKLSTHVLDTAHGRPAAAIAWSLEIDRGAGTWEPLKSGHTNADGRTDAPLLCGPELETATYRICFGVGAYFRGLGVIDEEPPFLEQVVLQVGLKAGQSYHVPLLTSPWSYSTYRGS